MTAGSGNWTEIGPNKPWVCVCLLLGESYAGVYVPTLVDAVVNGNEEGQTPHINIKVKHGTEYKPLRIS